MKQLGVLLILLLPFGLARAGTDGELAWESVTFCDGAKFCVHAESSEGAKIDLLEVKHKGVLIVIPATMYRDVKNPLFNEMRLLVTQRSDDVYENLLEIPFFDMKGALADRFVLRIHISNDEAYRSEIIESKNRQ
jgi:hypothetical protein